MKQINETFFQETTPMTRAQGEPLARMISLLMPDAAVFTVDKDRKISYWSRGAEKLLGFSALALTGEICLSGNRCQQCMRGCGLTESGKVAGAHLTLHTADGTPQPVIKYAIAFTREDGVFDGGLEVLIPHEAKSASQPQLEEFAEKYGLTSNAPEMFKVFDLIRRVAQTDMPVLIRGESGTGKELVARAIHGESPRKNAAFIAINCATLSAGLLESELFGHTKGAFTGAFREHFGVFSRAKGGTLFLDEIAELPFELQAKLLRVLETGEFTPVGGEKAFQADVRIVTATHKALREEVKNGNFRQDLLYRLRVFPIFLPNLQARKSDIPLLVHQMIQQQLTTQNIPNISAEAMECLMQYEWPGNVRELKNAIYYALVMFDGNTIQASDLPPEIGNRTQSSAPQPMVKKRQAKHSTQAILAQIQACDGNLTLAAQKLGMGRTTLWRHLKKIKPAEK
jgi:DNA-binding NtrC family response regulator